MAPSGVTAIFAALFLLFKIKFLNCQFVIADIVYWIYTLTAT